MFFIFNKRKLLERQKPTGIWIERYLISLDKKGRLVLPLEIREALDIKTDGKITLSVSSSQNGQVILKLSKASDSQITNSVAFSRNGRYLRKEGD